MADIPNSIDNAAASPRRPDRSAWMMLIILALTNGIAAVDRYNFAAVLEPMRRDLGATDAQMGLLAGAAFILCYSAFSVPMARLADRGNRRVLLTSAIVAWSLFTLLGGLVVNVWQAALSRIGLGVAEAAGPPTSMALISDRFRGEVRHIAVSIFQSGAALGGLLGVPLIGWVIDAHGWRSAFLVLGIIGLALAIPVWIILPKKPQDSEPTVAPATGEKAKPRSALWADTAALLSDSRLRLLYLSQLSVGIAVGAMPIWMMAYVMRQFSTSVFVASLVNALFFGLIMAIGYVCSGYAIAFLIRRTGKAAWGARFPALAAMLSAPVSVAMFLADDLITFVLLGCLFYVLLFSSRTAANTLALDFAPRRLSGLATSFLMAAVGIIGGGLAPWLTGALSDHLAQTMSSADALRWSLMAAVPAEVLLSGLMFLMISRKMARSS